MRIRAAAIALALIATSALAQTPRPVPAPPAAPESWPSQRVTDAAIGRGIERGVDYLLRTFTDGKLNARAPAAVTSPPGDTTLHQGMHALAVLALLQARTALQDERLDPAREPLKSCIAELRAMPMNGQYATYARGLRASALALLKDDASRRALRNDFEWLKAATINGGYTYGVPQRDPSRPTLASRPDNSNAQYGLLGIWAAVEAGMEMNDRGWKVYQDYWADQQQRDGTWIYRPAWMGNPPAHEGEGPLSMTAAALASLLVTHEHLDRARVGAAVGRKPYSDAVLVGMRWLENGDNCLRPPQANWAYTLYSVERVGLASGLKYFGQHDWYRALSAQILPRQETDGSWGDVIDTSFCVLFLARGRHPIMMNVLRFDGAWANRPQAPMLISRYVSSQLERPLNWQVVDVTRPWHDWMDAPILYLASHEAPKLTDEQVDQLRRYVRAGGLLFTHADGASPRFTAFAGQLATRLFPEYELRDVPDDHPIWSAAYKLPRKPLLRMVHNGTRILMLHSPTDIAIAWQQRETRSKPWAHDWGANLLVYAAGPAAGHRNRLSAWHVPASARPAASTANVIRIRHAGNWDPEPYAWERFALVLRSEHGIDLKLTAVDAAALAPAAALAHLTCSGDVAIGEDGIAALRRFVEAGGALVIDACGGSGPAAQSADRIARAVAPQAVFNPLPADGVLARLLSLRPGAAPAALAEAKPSVAALGKGRVIVSAFDLTATLLGSRTTEIAGYTTESAEAFWRELLK